MTSALSVFAAFSAFSAFSVSPVASALSALRSLSAVRRGVAAALVSGLTLGGSLAGATGAAALGGGGEAGRHQGGAVATLGGMAAFDRAVVRAGGKSQGISAGLFEMTVDGGGRLKTYGVDMHNPAQDQARYQETGWRETSLATNPNAGRIRWILQNSYPQVDDLVALAKRAGSGPLTQRTAAAGTQVAIWRYSDNADVDALDPAAEKLADWLEREAVNLPEPQASLALEPGAVAGRAGGRIGPVTIRTDADVVTLAPPVDATTAGGMSVTDADGKALDTAADGGRVHLAVPAGTPDGMAEVTAHATTPVPVGRAFAAADSTSQTQILAVSSEATVSATASVTWAEGGALPALSARENCVRRAVEIRAENRGQAPVTFELAGAEHTVAAGRSTTVTVPVAEDQTYSLTVSGAGGLNRTFPGVLDCQITGPAAPASAVGTQTGGATPIPGSAGRPPVGLETDLAATGGSRATPMIAGIAVTLVVIGGGAVLLLRDRKPSPR
ncbi:TQXA domain-containing protein [Streptomyces sp. NPDC057638]|uniref:TQXA domain-containing protein n=1 Tax=Streptomyces sp. NPDC057638 TaxID=3346190 RepID=UPI0036B550C4